MVDFPQLLKLRCFPLEKLWGGPYLSKIKKLKMGKVGETWELSTLEEGSCYYQDQRLQDYIGKNCLDIWGEEKKLTYLIKFIDTCDFLSIQVHPDDEYARLHENSSGKTECWIILNAAKDSGIYLGLKDGITKESFSQRSHRNEDVSDCLNFYKVEKGDFFYVPAGTVHSIGKDVLLLEVQQSSGITYRVWDWNRMDNNGKPRELHLNKALQVIKYENEFNNAHYFKIKENVFQDGPPSLLVQHPHFNVSVCNLNQGKTLSLDLSGGTRARAIVCVQGKIQVHRGNENILLDKFETLLIPFMGENELVLKTDVHSQFVFVS